MKKKILFLVILLSSFACFLIANTANAQRRSRNTGYEFRGRNDRHYNNYYSPRVNFRPSVAVFGRILNRRPNYTRLSYAGHPYYYLNGLFYSGYGANYTLIRPPLGMRLGFLPSGYWQMQYGGYPYFYYSGIFYQNTDNNEYQVVQAPLGAIVPVLPKDAKQMVVNGQVFFEYLGTYYKELIDEQGKVQYIIQGKDGVLNTNPTP